MHAMTKQSDIQHLQQRLRDRARQVQELEETIATLRAELAASMLPYTGHTVSADGRIITLGSGERYEDVTGAAYTEGETTYRREFKKLPPVPGSPAARVAEVLAATASADDEAVAEPMERAS